MELIVQYSDEPQIQCKYPFHRHMGERESGGRAAGNMETQREIGVLGPQAKEYPR